MNSPQMINETNYVHIIGKVAEEPDFNHEIYGEKFYIFSVYIKRLSKSFDVLPILISERLIDIKRLKKETPIELEGQYRSFNNLKGTRSRLVLNIFAREARLFTDEIDDAYENLIYFKGFVCKKPNYRTTPFGREITDMLLAVNRAYNKSDYIPCISWGRNARFCEKLLVGQEIQVWGRVQSRGYEKKFPDGNIIKRVAYEVSLTKLEL